MAFFDQEFGVSMAATLQDARCRQKSEEPERRLAAPTKTYFLQHSALSIHTRSLSLMPTASSFAIHPY